MTVESTSEIECIIAPVETRHLHALVPINRVSEMLGKSSSDLQRTALILYFKETRYFLSWKPIADSNSDFENPTVFIDKEYLKLLEIDPEEGPAFISFRFNISNASRFYVDPLSSDDWEIIEKFPDILQNYALLSQCSIVYVSQQLLFRLRESFSATMQVTKVEGKNGEVSDCYFIGNSCEIAIASKSRSIKRDSIIVKNAFHLKVKRHSSLAVGDCVYIFELCNPKSEYRLQKVIKGILKEYQVRSLIVGCTTDCQIQPGTIVIPLNIIMSLGLEENEFVLLEKCDKSISSKPVENVNILSSIPNSSALFRKICSELPPKFKLSNGTIFFNGENLDLLVFNLNNQSCIFAECINNETKILTQNIHVERRKNLPSLYQSQTEFCHHVLSKIQNYSSLCTGGFIILNGRSGSGKSILVDHLKSSLSALGFYVKRVRVGDNLSLESFRTLLEDVQLHIPEGLLLIDDIDEIFSSSNTSHYNSIQSFMKIIENCENLLVVATCANTQHIQPEILDLLGILSIEKIPALTDDEKHEFLRNITGNTFSSYEYLKPKLDGFFYGDLIKVSSNALIQTQNGSFDESFLKCLEMYSELNDGVSVETSKVKWDEVGGLKSQKEILLKSICWPITYSSIYKKSTLPSKRGVLLYGPPGSGKTMLAKACAEKAGLKLVTINCPEVIDKYVGESEQNIRRIFENARDCKPSLILFDEFDSIAGRRGEDQLGLTDRVVNQLLTELDGASEMNEVFIIATTSFPEKIDEALLRPGRIDQKILCELPDHSERIEIVKIHMKKKLGHFDEEFANYIASESEDWTPADLCSVVDNAKLLLEKENDLNSISLRKSSKDILKLKADVLTKEIGRLLNRKGMESSVNRKPEVQKLTLEHVQRAIEDSRIAAKKNDQKNVMKRYRNYKQEYLSKPQRLAMHKV